MDVSALDLTTSLRISKISQAKNYNSALDLSKNHNAEIAMMFRALETPKTAPDAGHDHLCHRLPHIQKYQCLGCMIGLYLSSSNQNTRHHVFMCVPRALKATAPSIKSLIFPAILPTTSLPHSRKVIFKESKSQRWRDLENKR
jgi:hypothetical protein